jgi:hypothetical protein
VVLAFLENGEDLKEEQICIKFCFQIEEGNATETFEMSVNLLECK